MATTAEPAGEVMSGIDVIRNDHEAIRKLFRSYQGTTDRDVKLSVARELVTTVSRHASAEERTIYPMITSIIPPTQGAKHLYDMMVLDDTVNKEVLSYLDTHVPQTDSEWALFDQTVDKFIMIEEEHMTKEEKQVLDVMDRSMTRDEKADLYTKFKAASANAPLHPHQPTTAYAAQVLHPVAGMVDRAAHAVTGMVNKVLHPADKTAAAAHQGTEQGKQHTV